MRLGFGVVLASSVMLATASPVTASSATVEVRDGHVTSGGDTALVLVRASCSGGTVLEALVTVSQENAYGMAGFPLQCTGRERLYVVRVESFDEQFRRDAATVSAYVLIQNDDSDTTTSASDSETVNLK